MQRSSPLAAMQPSAPPYGAWGCGAEAQTSYTEYGRSLGGGLNHGPPSFNFRDLSMEKVPVDYFNLKPMRGSSPTASLAADLSTNFHIEQSPQLPTPRRSLFSTNMFSTFNGRVVTTPPLPPSSSPRMDTDAMDISPLPHKVPFVVEGQLEPTPMDIPIDEINPSPESIQDSPLEPSKHGALYERRRPSLLRPSLCRAKGLTTSAVTLKSVCVENPPFKFGNGISAKPSALISPVECFEASPQRNGRPQSADSPSAHPMGPPPRYRQSSFNLKGIGQPTFGHIRKPSNPTQRPRKQFRRSLSMFEHPTDIMKQEEVHFESKKLDPVMDIDDAPRLHLPYFHSEDESLPRITKETMIDVLDGSYDQHFDRSLIVDCRFEYEFEGGHIDGAVNHNNKENFANQLFDCPSSGNTLIIFHCEYSACRAPLMAKHVRGRDRACNAHRYPNLTYPNVYILDGGYSAFFANYKLRCSPQDYVEMGDKKHESACEKGMGRVKQQRTKLSRAQTFAFGQHESPTTSGRQCTGIMSSMDIAIDSRVNTRKFLSKRVESF